MVQTHTTQILWTFIQFFPEEDLLALCFGVKKHARACNDVDRSIETMFAALLSSPNAFACSLISRRREGGSVRVLRYNKQFVTRKTSFTIENVTAKTALKEWAKTERAIERGEQVLLFRKGGINDAKDGGFQILANQFVIFPDVVSSIVER